MKIRYWGRILIAIASVSGSTMVAGPGQAQESARYFPQTQHTIRGQFLFYWTDQGGLAQQGFPISEEFQEKSDLNGQMYNVQYFERAVFEQHPENQPPYNTLLSQLGTFQYRHKYPNEAPNQQASTANPRKFAQTGKTLGGQFRTYWENHGGLAQQGFPISEEFQEKSDLNGQIYTVQYFERAVFEQHPENAGTPYEVLLSQLGTFQYRAKYQNPPPPSPSPPTPPPSPTPRPVARPALCNNRPCEPPANYTGTGENPPFEGSPPLPPADCPPARQGDITGQILIQGQPAAAGIRVLLGDESQTTGWLQFSRTTTEANGIYHFRNIAATSTSSNQKYYVKYVHPWTNANPDGRVGEWGAPGFTYTACTVQTVLPIEISDVQWTGTCDGEARTLPTTLTWRPRDATETYDLQVYHYSSEHSQGLGDSVGISIQNLRDQVQITAAQLPEPGMYAALLFIHTPNRDGKSYLPCVFNNTTRPSPAGATGMSGYFNRDWSFTKLQDLRDLPGGWTQVVPFDSDRVLFLNTPQGTAAVGHINDAGSFTQDSTLAGFSPGWTHVVAIIRNRLFFLNATTGNAAVAHVTTDGIVVTDRDLSGFTGSWTHVVTIADNRLFFLNATTGQAAVGHINADGSFTSDSNLSGFTGGWTHVVPLFGVSRLFFLNAAGP